MKDYENILKALYSFRRLYQSRNNKENISITGLFPLHSNKDYLLFISREWLFGLCTV
jgi:hypothetical protein